MDTFGYYRVTGLLHKNNLPRKRGEPLGKSGGFFYFL
jgi:hypothetical protein